jgi:hypothetical protein
VDASLSIAVVKLDAETVADGATWVMVIKMMIIIMMMM